MPRKKSAMRKAKRDAVREKMNRRVRQSIKKLVKKASLAKDLPTIQKVLDKAAKERIIHPGKARRLKSRLAAKFSKGNV